MAVKHKIVVNTSGAIEEKELNLGKAVRAKCLDCSAWSPAEVRDCVVELCQLHPFRFGKDPGRKLNLTDEQRAELSARMRRNIHGNEYSAEDDE